MFQPIAFLKLFFKLGKAYAHRDIHVEIRGYHVCPGDGRQVVRFGGQHLYPWSHPASPYLHFLLYKGVSLGGECVAQLCSPGTGGGGGMRNRK